MSRQTRRQFLQSTAAAGAAMWVAGRPAWALEQAKVERLNIACIGVGGKGSSDTDHAGALGNIVGLCDVDEDYLNAKGNKFPGAKKFADFREMLDKIGKDIDAVTVSTPDHTHAAAAVMAMKMGKHVYCQKPLTWSVYEARVMRETAAKYKVKTQMGNQGTAASGFRQAVEVIRSGAIGDVKEIHVWTNRPVWPQAPKITARPAEVNEVPKYLNWDLWLGPAPVRPYHHGAPEGKKRGTYHDFNWRGWLDFGTGALGDMACHTANMAFMATGLGSPSRISAQNGPLNAETFPEWAQIEFLFPQANGRGPIKFVWYEGKRDGQKVLPSAELLYGQNPPGSGSLIVGSKGTLYSPNDYGAQFQLFPKADFEGYKPPTPTIPRLPEGNDLDQKREWIAACKGEGEAMSNFAYAGLLTETILLGNVAMKAGQPIDFDAANLKITNVPSANAFLKRDYRNGWTL